MRPSGGSATRARTWGFGVVLGLVTAAALIADTPRRLDWPMFGQNIQNTAATETFARHFVGLKQKWTFTTGGDVSARAAVVNGVAYFPDWGGNLWALNTQNGHVIWSHQLSDYGLAPNTHSRTSPAVASGIVYVGTQEGGWLLAIGATTGELLWKTQVQSPSVDPYTMITTSPVVYGGLVYTGTVSAEEDLAASVPGFVCCKARGTVVAVHAHNGAIAWRTYTVPTGYSGGGVWGGNFAVDPSRGMLFAATGNNYSHPTDPAYLACISKGGTELACTSPHNHVDSILALDLNNGRVIWANKFVDWTQAGVTDGSDDWNVSCLVPPFTNCPTNAGPDFDFGTAPNLVTYKSHGRYKTLVGAGQKSGIYFALDPDTGAELWHTQVGPGSSLGGMQWGSASDGTRIYVSIGNVYGIPSPGGSAGFWAALDPATGAVLWRTPDPNGNIDIGPLAVADGVVYASSMGGAPTMPTMLALNAADGSTLWSFAAGSSVNAGATIVGDSVYWGSGYAKFNPAFTGNNKFYAFTFKERR